MTGTLTIGRVSLAEWPAVSEDTDSISVKAREYRRDLGSQAAVLDRSAGLLGHAGNVVPVVFSEKPHRNGWYRVDSPTVTEVTTVEESFTAIKWECALVKVGLDSEVEVESRLTGGNRTHASAAPAELWHAPASAAASYYVGTSTPGYVNRVGADNSVRVYRAIPASTHPRWSAPPDTALQGAVSIIVNGSLRTGLSADNAAGSWELSNGIVRVQPRSGAGTLRITSYLASGWGAAKVFDVKRGATSLGTAHHVTILRNDFCECVIRLTWDHSPGRTVADLTLARGSRHVGLYVQQYAAPSALRIDDNGAGGTVSDQLTAAGYIASTTSDADGNRWVIGTTVAATAAGTFGLQANVAALGLAGYIGCVRGGASPASGDAAADVNAQFLGQPTQAERLVRR